MFSFTEYRPDKNIVPEGAVKPVYRLSDLLGLRISMDRELSSIWSNQRDCAESFAGNSKQTIETNIICVEKLNLTIIH
jgi:hypothetical protein